MEGGLIKWVEAHVVTGRDGSPHACVGEFPDAKFGVCFWDFYDEDRYALFFKSGYLVVVTRIVPDPEYDKEVIIVIDCQVFVYSLIDIGYEPYLILTEILR